LLTLSLSTFQKNGHTVVYDENLPLCHNISQGNGPVVKMVGFYIRLGTVAKRKVLGYSVERVPTSQGNGHVDKMVGFYIRLGTVAKRVVLDYSVERVHRRTSSQRASVATYS
jgi:hypothetical protein